MEQESHITGNYNVRGKWQKRLESMEASEYLYLGVRKAFLEVSCELLLKAEDVLRQRGKHL